MKTFGKLNFGVQAVQAGQRSTIVNADPQIVASVSYGKFNVTPAVSKALNVAVGEYIMFLNNIAGVELAVQSKNDDVIAYAAELGIDINTKQGEDALIEKLTQWFIAKGVPQYTTKGAPLMATERHTKEEKAKYLEENRMTIVEANRESLVAQFGELSDEELAQKLTVDMVESPKYHAHSGSRVATSSLTNTGVGCQLNFTDSSIWKSLKKDLGDEATSVNRIYDVLINEAQTAEYNNGKENVTITILPIEFKEDVAAIRRGKVEE